ncbi:MAG: hypothetical protein IJ897_08390 [Prevotella sp.]|nr:hypothetical protein [Prevotella sp.]
MLLLTCMILGSCTSKHEVKTDFRPYADTCESCYDRLSHPIIPMSNKKECSDSIMARIKYIDSVRTATKRQWVETAQTSLELAKKEENLTQMFLFEEHLYIANKYRTFADRQLCDSIRLHYSKEMVQTAMQIEDADTIGIAITHYMDAMKHLGRETDMEAILKKVRSVESFVHNPDKYAKILCVIARKYSAIGDNDNAKKYLSKALYLSIKGNAETTEVTGRRAAQQLLDKGEIKEAVQTYYSVLLMRDSVVKEKDEAMAKQKEADEVFLHNIGLWTLLLLTIVCGITAFYYFQRRRKAESHSFKSEITALQETIAKHEETLQKLEKSEVKNKEEISAQKKTIEKLKNTIMERLKTGKAIYETLQKGEPFPNEIKGGEEYLIDYYVIFMPKKYERWKRVYEGLTPRMYTYLILQDMGYSETDIQRILGISPSGLRSLRSRTMGKRRSN